MEKVPLHCPPRLQIVKSLACSLVVAPFSSLEMKLVKWHEVEFFSSEQEVHQCLHHQLQDAEIKIIIYKT